MAPEVQLPRDRGYASQWCPCSAVYQERLQPCWCFPAIAACSTLKTTEPRTLSGEERSRREQCTSTGARWRITSQATKDVAWHGGAGCPSVRRLSPKLKLVPVPRPGVASPAVLLPVRRQDGPVT